MIPRIFIPPQFETEEENFRAKFINGFGLTLAALLVLSLIPQFIIATLDYTILVLIGLIAIVLLSLYLLHKGYLQASGLIIVTLSWLGITFQAATAEGVRDVIVVGYIAIGLLASIILNWRSGGFIIIASIGAIWVLSLLEINGVLVPLKQPTLAYARDLSIVFAVITALIYFSTTSLRDAIRRATLSEQALIASNNNLQDLNLNLEERVASRTIELESANQRNERRARQFEATAQVTRATASNQSLESLLPLLAQVISEQFGFYHTGIFLTDDNQEYAVLVAASSAGGKRMLQRGHKLLIGQTGIVGVVAATGAPRIALDVGNDAAFFGNPDLPNTRSEAALPLRAGNEVIGVLDVQSTEEKAFQPEDVEVLATLADQVTIAIQNARSYEITYELLKRAETTSGAYLEESWKALQTQNKRFGYLASGNTLKQLEKTISSPHIEQAIACREVVVEGGKKPVLAIPIHLREDIVGVIDIQMPREHDWDSDEIDIAKAVAERLSLALETSLLIETTQRRAERERTVSNITSKIRSVNDPQIMIQTAIEELRNALGASRVDVIPQSIKSAEKQGK